MNGSFQHWYYGEDGTNPLFRLRKMHKICFAVLLLSIVFAFVGPKYDTLSLQIYSPALYFTWFFCIGLCTKLLGPHWDIVIHMNRGVNALIVFIVSLILAIFTAWLVLPLYLLLFAADFRYKLKVSKTKPEWLEIPKPTYKDLSK